MPTEIRSADSAGKRKSVAGRYGKYLLEQSAWGSMQRVETMAKDSLNMHSPQPQTGDGEAITGTGKRQNMLYRDGVTTQ